MNIHEYQAKDLLRRFKAPVPKGVLINNVREINKKIKAFVKSNYFKLVINQ